MTALVINNPYSQGLWLPYTRLSAKNATMGTNKHVTKIGAVTAIGNAIALDFYGRTTEVILPFDSKINLSTKAQTSMLEAGLREDLGKDEQAQHLDQCCLHSISH